MLVWIAKQIKPWADCFFRKSRLSIPFWQATSVQNFRNVYPYVYTLLEELLWLNKLTSHKIYELDLWPIFDFFSFYIFFKFDFVYMIFTKFWTKCPYLCLGFFGNTIIIIPGNYVGPLKGRVAYENLYLLFVNTKSTYQFTGTSLVFTVCQKYTCPKC